MTDLAPEVWDDIFDHSRQDYPAECCGIVTEDGSGTHRVHRCDNIQDRLHSIDPETHPRTPREAYRMDDLQVHRIVTQAEEESGRVVAFYHSHIDCDAYFSEEDRMAATPFGQPAFPEVTYLVVSVVEGELRGKKAFRWDDGGKCFAEVELQDAPSGAGSSRNKM